MGEAGAAAPLGPLGHSGGEAGKGAGGGGGGEGLASRSQIFKAGLEPGRWRAEPAAGSARHGQRAGVCRRRGDGTARSPSRPTAGPGLETSADQRSTPLRCLPARCLPALPGRDSPDAEGADGTAAARLYRPDVTDSLPEGLDCKTTAGGKVAHA